MSGEHQTLISLAILKSDLDDERRDYIGYLESFINPILGSWPDEPITDSEVAKKFEEEHGLKIPERTIQLVLRRIARRGYLEKSHGVYHVSKSLPDSNLEQKRVAASSHINKVFESLKEYAANEFQKKWSDSETENSILSFLSHFGIDYLRAYIFRSALPDIPETVQSNQYIVASFIQSAYEAKSSVFESVVVIIKGQMYGNALTCPDLESIQKSFRSLTIYFDTPLLLSLLNLQGKQEYESIVDLVLLLKNLGAKLAIFDHTAAELESVLSASANNIENPDAVGRVVREMRRQGLRRGDITLKLSGYESELNSFGVSVQKTPRYEKSFQIDEAALDKEISNNLRYRNERAKEYDINSIRSIFVLRKGVSPARLEDAKAIFVTNNDALSKAAFNFGRSHNSAREVSSVITDFSLANIAWLKSPMAAPNLPAREVIATCYAALEPKTNLWERYLSELDRLKEKGELDADTHAVLRVSDLAERALMDFTLGDEESLKGDTVNSIMERVKGALAVEHKREVTKERQQHDNTKRILDREMEEKKRLEARIDSVSRGIAGFACWLLAILFVIALMLGMLAGSGIVPPYVKGSNVLTAILNTLIVVAVIWGVYSSFTGNSLILFIENLKLRLSQNLSASIRRRLGWNQE